MATWNHSKWPLSLKKVDGKIIRPRRWDRDREGKMVPPDHPGENNLIDLVERKFRGTERWFRHPLWKGLGQTTLTEKEIIEALATLKPAVSQLVLERNYSDGHPRSSPAVILTREIAHTFIQKGSLGALGAAVLLVRFFALIASS